MLGFLLKMVQEGCLYNCVPSEAETHTLSFPLSSQTRVGLILPFIWLLFGWFSPIVCQKNEAIWKVCNWPKAFPFSISQSLRKLETKQCIALLDGFRNRGIPPPDYSVSLLPRW